MCANGHLAGNVVLAVEYLALSRQFVVLIGRQNLESEAVANGVDVGIEEDFATVEYQHGVDYILQVAHLVGGDDERLVVGNCRCHHLAEGAFRRDVYSVCRLIHY